MFDRTKAFREAIALVKRYGDEWRKKGWAREANAATALVTLLQETALEEPGAEPVVSHEIATSAVVSHGTPEVMDNARREGMEEAAKAEA